MKYDGGMVVTETRVQVTKKRWISDIILRKNDVYYYTYSPDVIHRDNDLPALIRTDGSQYWLQHGRYHREGDLPAVIWANGDQEWRINGRLHREGNKPTTINSDGSIQEYWVHDQLHSLLTPADYNGWYLWYLNDLQYFRD